MRLKHVWDVLIITLVLFTIYLVPLEIGFGRYDTEHAILNNPDYYFNSNYVHIVFYLSDVCFIIDMVLVFMTSYIDELGIEVRDSKKVAYRYLHKEFFVDLLAAIPMELMVTSTSAASVGLVKALKLPRLLRASRIFLKLEYVYY